MWHTWNFLPLLFVLSDKLFINNVIMSPETFAVKSLRQFAGCIFILEKVYETCTITIMSVVTSDNWVPVGSVTDTVGTVSVIIICETSVITSEFISSIRKYTIQPFTVGIGVFPSWMCFKCVLNRFPCFRGTELSWYKHCTANVAVILLYVVYTSTIWENNFHIGKVSENAFMNKLVLIETSTQMGIFESRFLSNYNSSTFCGF